ncbi:glycosyltransferase family 2 protein [Pontibacillus salicampi]|uniref:Glycosyltransferase family 2 protein n=1 Tax=Pontibacillus salicampi TaxID=1449801 RepID=A0ABV6LK50_9BACI
MKILKQLSNRHTVICLDQFEEWSKSGTVSSPTLKLVPFTFNQQKQLPIHQSVLKHSMVVCLDTIDTMNNPQYVFEAFNTAMNHASIGLITKCEPTDTSPGMRDIDTFKTMMDHYNCNAQFVGYSYTDTGNKRIVGIIGNTHNYRAPINNSSFKVIALMAVYNEEDIIEYSLNKLIEQDIYVYVIDNWSTDRTLEIIQTFRDDPHIIGYESYPSKNNAQKKFHFLEILHRKEILAATLNADWFIHCDADEIRESPWFDLNLKEGIQYIDSLGYNAIDHTVLNFSPTNDHFISGNFEEHFRHFEIGVYISGQVKTWKKTDNKVSLAVHGGHQAMFEGRRVAPFNFLLKHYPLRSQQHAERKIFTERKPRYRLDLKNIGWHSHYDQYEWGAPFIRNPEELLVYDKESFYKNYVLERLIGF